MNEHSKVASVLDMLQPGLLDLPSARRRAVGVPCRGAAPQKYSAGSARPRRAQVFFLSFGLKSRHRGPSCGRLMRYGQVMEGAREAARWKDFVPRPLSDRLQYTSFSTLGVGPDCKRLPSGTGFEEVHYLGSCHATASLMPR